MPDTNDILITLRDLGVTTPRHGDGGDDQVCRAVAREIAGHRHTRRRVQMPRRRAVRFSALAAAATVAAGVIIATGTFGGSSTPRLAFRGPHASQMGPVKTIDTADIIRRVKAKVAAATQTGTVIDYATYNGGQLSSDGSLINLGWKMDDGYQYAAPDGNQYAQGTLYYKDGSTELTTSDDWVPGATNETGNDTETVINPTTSQYSQTSYQGIYRPNAGPTPSLFSTPAQVQQALQGGQVTQQGAATINGTRTIALSIVAPNAPGNPNTDIAMYVNAQTDQPLRTVAIVNGAPDLTVSDWLPATPKNVTMVKDDSIPSGDTKTTPQQVDAETYEH